MSDFTEKLGSLCAKEAAQMTGDKDRAGVAIEALARCLALTICKAADGDPARIDVLISGAENYIATEAASWAPIVKLAANMRQAPDNA